MPAADAEVLDELRRLRTRLPQVTGALAAAADGLVIAQDADDTEADAVAALTAASLAVAVRMAAATGRGEFRELLVRGVDGYVATYAAGPLAVLTVLAEPRVNVGRLHLESRQSGARIAELVGRHYARDSAEHGTDDPMPRRIPRSLPPPTGGRPGGRS